MAYNYEYPYTDPNRYNADWLLHMVKHLEDKCKVDTETAPYVNVKDFGAVGDGVVDDTKAFQTALSKSHYIFIPYGIYMVQGIEITDGISSSNFHLLGELSSKGKPILKRLIDSNKDLIRVPSSPRTSGGIVIENLEIDGSCTLDNHIYGRNGIELNYGTHNSIKNCYIHNVKERGIYLYDCPYSNVINCEIAYTYEASGIVATNQKMRAFYNISECYIHDTEIDGIAIAADSVLVNHCYINNVGLRNLETTAPSCCVFVAEGSGNTVVSNCELSNATFAGVELQSEHNHINNNYIRECGWGVAIINNNNMVTNNYCYRCNQTGNNNNACGIGVYNTDSSRDFTHNLIIGNSIDSNNESKFGISLINATKNLVAMNSIRNTTDVDVYQNISDSNTIVNNI